MELISGLVALAVGWFWFAFAAIGSLLVGVVSIGSMVLWIWALIDVLQKEVDEQNTKLIWVLVIVLAGWIGALIYLFVRRPERVKILGR